MDDLLSYGLTGFPHLVPKEPEIPVEPVISEVPETKEPVVEMPVQVPDNVTDHEA